MRTRIWNCHEYYSNTSWFASSTNSGS